MKNPYLDFFPDGSAIDNRRLRALGHEYSLYAIFITARSGSSWLGDMIRTAGLGDPIEWFNYTESVKDDIQRLFGVSEINAYIDAIAKGSTSGAVGVQLSWPQLMFLLQGGLIDPSPLRVTFYLRRRDVLLQAISLYRSGVSGYFHATQSESTLKRAYDSTPYDADGIGNFLIELIDCEVELERTFSRCGLSPLPFFYEDVCANPGLAIRRFAKALGRSFDGRVPESSHRRISDDRNSAWAEAFRRDRRDLFEAQMRRRPSIEPTPRRVDTRRGVMAQSL